MSLRLKDGLALFCTDKVDFSSGEGLKEGLVDEVEEIDWTIARHNFKSMVYVIYLLLNKQIQMQRISNQLHALPQQEYPNQ